jgi:hypothetical protein
LVFTPPAAPSPLTGALGALTVQAAASADGPPQVPQPGDQLVLGGTYTLESGDTLAGNLLVLGGSAALEADSTVEGDIVVLGGSLQVDGLVEGDLGVVGGLVTLGSTAVIEGDVNALSGSVQREEGAVIEGDLNQNTFSVTPFVAPGAFHFGNMGDWSQFFGNLGGLTPVAPAIRFSANPLWDILWFGFRSFLWAALAVLVALFAPRASARAGAAGAARPPAAGCLGCSTLIVAPLVLLVLVITLCGIPVALVLAFILALAWAFGVVALGLEAGKRLAVLLKQDWAPPVSAGVGTFGLTLVMNGAALVPCIGWMVPLLVGCVGLGAVLLTRFGAQDYPVDLPVAAISSPVAPYSATVPMASATVVGEALAADEAPQAVEPPSVADEPPADPDPNT